MRLAVITPVGPGHEAAAARAMASVDVACGASCFGSVRHVIVEDHAGNMGRSHARNIGMDSEADWFFFLDADDTMRPDALTLNRFNEPATFGAVSLNGRIYDRNIQPCGWRQIALNGARGTLSMGCFVRADIARAVRFDESLDAGEDFDFYLRLPGFTKIARPLVDIGYDTPSATGPRGYDNIDWTGICNGIIEKYVTANPEKFNLRGDAILAAAQRAGSKPRPSQPALP